jgi:alkanesulfonate monooxygenase SsuD/methylene tetrahydromethanopterin reductase-like flavin-dependent oxidoreductase (luciferase family)
MSLEEYRQRGLVGTPDQLTERIEAIAKAGIDYLIVYLPRVAYDHTPLHLFAGQVIPHFTNLSG